MIADHTSADLVAQISALRARVAELEQALHARPPYEAPNAGPASAAALDDHYRLMFEHNPFPMFIYDVETLAFLDVNQAAVQHYGYTRDEFLRMTLVGIYPAQDVPALLQSLSMPPAAPSLHAPGWRHRLKDGTIIYVDVVSRPVEFAGHAARLVLVNDITRRRRAEQVIEGQRYFFELLATGAPLDHVLDELIRTVEIQIGTGICSVLLVDDLGRLRHGSTSTLSAAYARAIDGIEIGPSAGSCGTAAFRGETVIVSDIATDPLWTDYRDLALAHGLRACWSVPFRDHAGRVLGTFAVYYDQTRSPTDQDLMDLRNAAYLAAVAVERINAEAALRASERRYRLVSNAVNDVIWEWEAHADTLRWSDCAESVFGYPQEQIGSYATWWDERLHPDDSARVIAGVNRAIAGTEQFWSAEYRFRRADDSYAHVLDRAYIIRDDSGRASRMIGAMQDITERKRAEAEIRRLNEELERRVAERTAQLESANKELEAFSYSVSHDLRAPLRHIDGFARMLAQREADRLDPTSARYLGIVSDAARKMGQLIDDLLSFSRLGRAEMRTQAVDLNQLVADVRAELAPVSDGRTVVWDVQPLPIVCGDPALLRVVLVNLLSNALKYTTPCPEARIAIAADCAGADECVVTVCDNGVGFDMQYVHKLFGVFQRLHRDEEFEGTGIGLATVRRIINRHGGRIWAEGELGAGATFHFALKRHSQG